MNQTPIDLYFSDFITVSEVKVERYGAFNISLITDLLRFIVPFLLFNSRKRTYKAVHDSTGRYLRFLKDKSSKAGVDMYTDSRSLGHPDIRTTLIYADAKVEALRDVVKQLEVRQINR